MNGIVISGDEQWCSGALHGNPGEIKVQAGQSVAAKAGIRHAVEGKPRNAAACEAPVAGTREAESRNDMFAVRIQHWCTEELRAERLAQQLVAEIDGHRSRAAEAEIGLAIPVELLEYGVIRGAELASRIGEQQATVGQQQSPPRIELADNQAAIHAEGRVNVARYIDGDERVTVPDDDAAVGARAQINHAVAEFEI